MRLVDRILAMDGLAGDLAFALLVLGTAWLAIAGALALLIVGALFVGAILGVGGAYR